MVDKIMGLWNKNEDTLWFKTNVSSFFINYFNYMKENKIVINKMFKKKLTLIMK